MIGTMRKAGQALGTFFARPGVQKFAKDAAINAAIEGGVGVAAEQVLPRALGIQPEASVGESILRQGVSAAVGAPLATGLQQKGVPSAIANFAGQLAGQPVGQSVTQAILPGNQGYPLGVDPEPAEAGHAQYGQLMAKQQIEAASERERYNNMINLALARNYNPPSFIHHQSSGTPAQDIAMNLVKTGFSSTAY